MSVSAILFRASSVVFIPKIYLVDDDIDPTKIADVVWALAARVHPTRRQVVFDDARVIRPAHWDDADGDA